MPQIGAKSSQISGKIEQWKTSVYVCISKGVEHLDPSQWTRFIIFPITPFHFRFQDEGISNPVAGNFDHPLPVVQAHL